MIKKDIGKKSGEQQGDTPKKKPMLGGLKVKVTRTKPIRAGGKGAPPIRFGLRMNKKTLVIAAGSLALVILLAVVAPPLIKGIAARQQERKDEAYTVIRATPRPTPTPDPGAPPVIDLSGITQTVQLESAMNRINEPTPWEEELLYSAGQSSGIDEMIFTKLYTYNMQTKEEIEQAQSEITNKSGLPGELYEARMNDHWIAWLDTNQAGTNVIHGKDRLTGETFVIKESALIRPQIRLYGDTLVYLIQENADQDLLYLYNLNDREPMLIEAFTDPTYGTCPPAIFGDIVIWAIPNPDNSGASILKWLDLSTAFSTDAADTPEDTTQDPVETEPIDHRQQDLLGDDEADASPSPDGDADAAGEGDDPYVNGGDPVDEGGPSEEDDPFLNDGGMIRPDKEYGEALNPGSFAIYPVTNGDMIAYLDSLDPANANLMLMRKGRDPVAVAQGVGRVFDVGEDFVVYTQDDVIYLYFWDLKRYAQLTPEGQRGLLSRSCVDGHTVIWYDANDPNNKGDTVYISTVETPSGDLLEY